MSDFTTDALKTLSEVEQEYLQFKVNVHHWLVWEFGYPLDVTFPPSMIRPWLDLNYLAREWKSWDDLNFGSSESLEDYVAVLREECGL